MTTYVDQPALLPARETLVRWRWDPVAFVRECFGAEPDEWQAEGLQAFPHNNRIAFKACKGPGKTCLLAWYVWNFLLTRPYPLVACTSITGDNLSDNLWTELARWQNKSPLLREWFTWTKSQVLYNDHPATWFATARTWPKQADPERQAETLAGIHADYVLFVLDESGGIPQAVMATAEAVLASGVETKVVQAGNPSHLEGPLYRACTTDRHLWHVVNITGDPDNPKRSPRISLEYARQQIATYGRDNPWVRVNVLGEWPEQSLNALLGPTDVERAMARHLRPDVYEWAQKRLGVDVARFGDDRNVIFPRQGAVAFRPLVMRNERTTNIAARVAHASDKWGAEMILIDDTGHWGHGVVDNLLAAGLGVYPIIFSDKALDPRYRNRRAEMWIGMAEWVKNGGALPNVPELVGELITPTYTFVNGVFVLEDKDQIKARLGRSPDLADALALTFALPDMPGAMQELTGGIRGEANRAGRAAMHFDPYAELDGEPDRDRSSVRARFSHDPLDSEAFG